MLIEISEDMLEKAMENIVQNGYFNVYQSFVKEDPAIAEMLSLLHDRMAKDSYSNWKKEHYMLYGFILSWSIFKEYMKSKEWN